MVIIWLLYKLHKYGRTASQTCLLISPNVKLRRKKKNAGLLNHSRKAVLKHLSDWEDSPLWTKGTSFFEGFVGGRGCRDVDPKSIYGPASWFVGSYYWQLNLGITIISLGDRTIVIANHQHFQVTKHPPSIVPLVFENTPPESRSNPKVSCVKSLLPMEKPSWTVERGKRSRHVKQKWITESSETWACNSFDSFLLTQFSLTQIN